MPIIAKSLLLHRITILIDTFILIQKKVSLKAIQYLHNNLKN